MNLGEEEFGDEEGSGCPVLMDSVRGSERRSMILKMTKKGLEWVGRSKNLGGHEWAWNSQY